MNEFEGLTGVYSTILLDPPWRFQNRTGKVAPEHRRLHRYRTLGLAELAALPIARHTCAKSHIYLWCPNALLDDGLKLLAAWGFTYKTNLVWYKIRKDGGPDGRGVGFYFRNVTELVLFGVRGGLRTLAPARSQVNVLATRKREHSRKPEEFYSLIEQCSPGPYLELFARRRVPGWTQWGDQVDTYAETRSHGPAYSGALDRRRPAHGDLRRHSRRAIDMLKLAYRNLLSRPVRSLLALLGLTVAIAGMVGLFSVANGLDRLVNSTFEQIPGLIAVQPGAPIPLFSTLPAAWGEEIKAVPGVRIVNLEVWQRVNLINEKFIVSPPRLLFGTDIATRLQLGHATYREAMLEGQGRYLTLEDRGTKNAVVSRQIAEEFQIGVGDRLRVNGHEITIVGLYHTGSMLLDVAIVLDIDQVRSMTRFDTESVSAFYIEPSGDVPEVELIAKIQEVFRGRALEQWNPASALGLPAAGSAVPTLPAIIGQIAQNLARPPAGNGGTAEHAPDGKTVNGVPCAGSSTSDGSATAATGSAEALPIEVRSARDWSEKIDDFSQDLDLFLALMTTIAVTIAVLSIINTMLMSVSERIIEFGILKANGWTQWDVARLITWESSLLGFGGGVVGCLAGWIATFGINAAWPDRIYLYAGPGLLAFGLVFSVGLGVIGGLYPAIWAMRMAPMEAIRRA